VDGVVDAGLWVPNGASYDIHDYVQFQQTRSEVEQEREQWRKRQRRYREGDMDA
jgi:hypothetical protein